MSSDTRFPLQETEALTKSILRVFQGKYRGGRGNVAL